MRVDGAGGLPRWDLGGRGGRDVEFREGPDAGADEGAGTEALEGAAGAVDLEGAAGAEASEGAEGSVGAEGAGGSDGSDGADDADGAELPGAPPDAPCRGPSSVRLPSSSFPGACRTYASERICCRSESKSTSVYAKSTSFPSSCISPTRTSRSSSSRMATLVRRTRSACGSRIHSPCSSSACPHRPHTGHAAVRACTEGGCDVPWTTSRSAGGTRPGHAHGAAPGTVTGGMRAYGDASSGARCQPCAHGACRATLRSADGSVHERTSAIPPAYTNGGMSGRRYACGGAKIRAQLRSREVMWALVLCGVATCIVSMWMLGKRKVWDPRGKVRTVH